MKVDMDRPWTREGPVSGYTILKTTANNTKIMENLEKSWISELQLQAKRVP